MPEKPTDSVPNLDTKRFADSSNLPVGDELRRLLRVAAKALQAEDQLLRAALEAQEDIQGTTIANGRGLTYWVYETTLVYTIWKAWLHEAHVEWEVKKEHNGSQKWFDLKLRLPKPLLVEAKWWNANTKAAMDAVASDIKKLEEAGPAESGLFLAFWWGTKLDEELRKADELMRCHEPREGLIEVRELGEMSLAPVARSHSASEQVPEPRAVTELSSQQGIQHDAFVHPTVSAHLQRCPGGKRDEVQLLVEVSDQLGEQRQASAFDTLAADVDLPEILARERRVRAHVEDVDAAHAVPQPVDYLGHHPSRDQRLAETHLVGDQEPLRAGRIEQPLHHVVDGASLKAAQLAEQRVLVRLGRKRSFRHPSPPF